MIVWMVFVRDSHVSRAFLFLFRAHVLLYHVLFRRDLAHALFLVLFRRDLDPVRVHVFHAKYISRKETKIKRHYNERSKCYFKPKLKFSLANLLLSG